MTTRFERNDSIAPDTKDNSGLMKPFLDGRILWNKLLQYVSFMVHGYRWVSFKKILDLSEHKALSF